MGEAESLLLAVIADNQIAQSAEQISLVVALADGQTLVDTFNGRQRDVTHPTAKEVLYVQCLITQTEVLVFGTALSCWDGKE